MGLTSSAVAEQLQFLLSGVPVTAVREDIRTVQVVARSAGEIRVIGHTDRVGSEQSNDAFSLKRAIVVQELLLKKEGWKRQLLPLFVSLVQIMEWIL